MHLSSVLVTNFALMTLTLAQSSDVGSCTNAEISSCLLNAYPSGAVTTGPSSLQGCPDEACACSAISLQSECYKTYCPDLTLPADFTSAYVGNCGTAPAGAATNSPATTTDGTALITPPADVKTKPVATSSAGSTSSAGAEILVKAVPAASLLGILVGIVLRL